MELLQSASFGVSEISLNFADISILLQVLVELGGEHGIVSTIVFFFAFKFPPATGEEMVTDGLMSATH